MDTIALFGAGEIGSSLLKRLRAEKKTVTCFLDNYKSGVFCGLPIVNPRHMASHSVGVYIATLEQYDEIEAQLNQSGFTILGSKKRLETMIASHHAIHTDVDIEFNKAEAIAQINCFAVDIIDSCQLKCPCCYRGLRTIPNSGNIMPLDTFAQVIHKVQEHNFNRVILYNWSEPFLVKDLELYITLFREIMGQNAFLGLSSNLSMEIIPHLKPVLYAGVSELLVSISGFSQEMHEKYHRGSRIETVKSHLEYISTFVHDISTQVVVKFLDFGYNSKERQLFESYADKLGLKFFSILGAGSPLAKDDKSYLNDMENHLKKDLSKRWRMDRYMEGIHKACNSAFSIDWKADLYLCCCYPNFKQFKIGNYLEDDITQLLLRRQMHPFCTGCDAKVTKVNGIIQ